MDELPAVPPPASPMIADSAAAPGANPASMPAPVDASAAAEAAEAAVDSPVAPEMSEGEEGMEWFAVHVAVGFEGQVRDELEERFKKKFPDRFGQILLPTEKIESLSKPRKGRQPKLERNLYPGYLFIQMRMDPETWHLVKSTRRVTGFIGGARDEPAALQKRDMEIIHERIAAGQKPKAVALFATGDMVRVKEGPFSDFTGAVDSVSPDRRRLTVSVMVFGRSTPVELAFEQVEKV